MKAYILADPDIINDKTKYVEGWGWDHTRWLLEQWPTYVRPLFSLSLRDHKLIHLNQHALEADPVVAGRPVILQSKDGHALWVSLAVLQSMHPLPDEVEGGVIVRDAAGQPTGVSIPLISI